MISDADRRRLHDALVQSIGPQPSEVLMELLPPAGWTDLATRTDLLALKTDIEIAKTELRIEIHDVRNEIHDVRNDVQDLRSRVDGIVPKLVMANIASMLGVAGLVLGAVAIA